MNPGPGRREPLAGSKLLASARHRTYCCAHRLLTHCSVYLTLTLALTSALTSTPAPMPPTASCSGSQSRRILTLTEAPVPVCEVQCEGHGAPWRAVCDRLAMYYYSITLCHTDKLESDESSEMVVMSCVVLLKSRSKTMNHLVPRCGVWTVARCTSWLVRGWVVQ